MYWLLSSFKRTQRLRVSEQVFLQIKLFDNTSKWSGRLPLLPAPYFLLSNCSLVSCGICWRVIQSWLNQSFSPQRHPSFAVGSLNIERSDSSSPLFTLYFLEMFTRHVFLFNVQKVSLNIRYWIALWTRLLKEHWNNSFPHQQQVQRTIEHLNIAAPAFHFHRKPCLPLYIRCI